MSCPQGQPSSMVTPMKDHNIDISRKKAIHSGNVTTPSDRPEASPLPTLHFSQIFESPLLKESVRIIHLSSNFYIKLFCPNLRELVFQCCIRVLRRPLMSSPDAPFSQLISLRLSCSQSDFIRLRPAPFSHALKFRLILKSAFSDPRIRWLNDKLETPFTHKVRMRRRILAKDQYLARARLFLIALEYNGTPALMIRAIDEYASDDSFDSDLLEDLVSHVRLFRAVTSQMTNRFTYSTPVKSRDFPLVYSSPTAVNSLNLSPPVHDTLFDEIDELLCSCRATYPASASLISDEELAEFLGLPLSDLMCVPLLPCTAENFPISSHHVPHPILSPMPWYVTRNSEPRYSPALSYRSSHTRPKFSPIYFHLTESSSTLSHNFPNLSYDKRLKWKEPDFKFNAFPWEGYPVHSQDPRMFTLPLSPSLVRSASNICRFNAFPWEGIPHLVS